MLSFKEAFIASQTCSRNFENLELRRIESPSARNKDVSSIHQWLHGGRKILCLRFYPAVLQSIHYTCCSLEVYIDICIYLYIHLHMSSQSMDTRERQKRSRPPRLAVSFHCSQHTLPHSKSPARKFDHVIPEPHLQRTQPQALSSKSPALVGHPSFRSKVES